MVGVRLASERETWDVLKYVSMIIVPMQLCRIILSKYLTLSTNSDTDEADHQYCDSGEQQVGQH